MYTGYIMYTLYTVQLTREEVCKLYSLYNGRYGAFCCIIYIFLYINLYRRRALYTVYTRIQGVSRPAGGFACGAYRAPETLFYV